MLRIQKSLSPVPSVLRGAEAKKWHRELADHYSKADSSRARTRAPTPPRELYSGEVSKRLLAIQKGRCAYCESELLESPRVTTYRPLSNATDEDRGADSPDHYTWFALEWRNLLLLCKTCEHAKRNIFPVRNSRIKPMSMWEAAASEKPLLLNPFTTRPESHLLFLRNGTCIPLSPRGAATIDALNLNRAQLIVHRREANERAIKLLLSSPRPTEREVRWLFETGVAFPGAVSVFLRQLCLDLGIAIPDKRSLIAAVTESLIQLLARRNAPRIDQVASDVGQQLARRAALRFGQETEGNASLEPISAIRISDFKSIKDLKLDLNDKGDSYDTPCLMLLGENSVGKSSILQAIALSLCSPGAMRRLKLDRAKYVRREANNWDAPSSRAPSVALTFGDSAQHHFMWPSTSVAQRNRKRNLPVVLAYGVTRLLDEDKASLQVSISPLFEASHTLPNPERWLRALSDHQFNAVARALRIILALREDDDIYRENDSDRRIMVRTQGRVAPLSRLSDGYKSLLALIINIMSVLLKDRQDLEFAEGVVLIDEIESHLHPRWKMRVVGALRKALPRVQFIFTTHDPLCLRGMKHGEVVVMYRDQKSELHAVTELPDVSKLRVDQLLTSEFFGLSSAIDPEQDKIAAQLSELAAIPEPQLTDQQRRKRDELLASYPGVQIIGSSVDRQIVSQAITRHLDEQSQQSYWSHLDARKDSVKRILDALKRASEL